VRQSYGKLGRTATDVCGSYNGSVMRFSENGGPLWTPYSYLDMVGVTGSIPVLPTTLQQPVDWVPTRHTPVPVPAGTCHSACCTVRGYSKPFSKIGSLIEPYTSAVPTTPASS